MPKKRIIFTLLYADGGFNLSRNFRLQRVGDLGWLRRNYNFAHVSRFIDELVVLDVTRGSRDHDRFCDTLKALSESSFVPIAAGGGVRSAAQAQQLLRSGADKVVVNTPVFEHPTLVGELAQAYGQQCVVASLDLKRTADGGFEVRVEAGSRPLPTTVDEALQAVDAMPVGELYLNSVDRDGTGQGYDFAMLDRLPAGFSRPVILAGGAGNAGHMAEGLSDARVDAVATAHLFNFIADGLRDARQSLLDGGQTLARWPFVDLAAAKQ